MYQIDVGAMQGMDQMQDSVFPFNLFFPPFCLHMQTDSLETSWESLFWSFD
mgnify:CR=1 FL=1